MPFRRYPRQLRQLVAYVIAGGLTAVAHYSVLIGLVELGQSTRCRRRSPASSSAR